jgi:hypothetical protein
METRLVHLEWDRTHEEFDAVVRAESDDGVIVTELLDFVPRRGWKWIPSDEIVTIDDLAPDSAQARLAQLRSFPAEPLDAALTSLPALVDFLVDGHSLVALWEARTGSSEMLVGMIGGHDGVVVELDLVSPAGQWENERHGYELEDLISVEWGSDYLLALEELAGPRHLAMG